MIIGIAMYTANTTERTGVAWYVFHLVKQLALLCPSDVKLRLYVDRPLVADFFPLPDCVEVRVLHHPLKYVWTHTRLSYEVWRHPVDVLFVPSHVLPLFCHVPMVMTIHDIAAIHLPQTYSRFQRWYTIVSARYALRRARAIVVPSLVTKKDLETLNVLRAAPIHVVPLGVDESQYQCTGDIATKTVCDDLGITTSYFLFVGRLENKKNVQGILEAYRKFREMSIQRVQLVLVGKLGQGYEMIATSLREHPYKNDIIVRNTWVSQEIVQALYTSALACVYPSLYEGFGLNVLESLLFGVPVIVSRSGSLAEIGDTYVLRVNAHNTDEIAQAMVRVCTDQDFSVLVKKKGPEYVRTFTWEKTARETLQILTNVVV